MWQNITWWHGLIWFSLGLVMVCPWWRTLDNEGFVKGGFLSACRISPRKAMLYLGASAFLGPLSLVALFLLLFVLAEK